MKHLQELLETCHPPFKPVIEAALNASNSPEYLAYWCTQLYQAAVLDFDDDQKALSKLLQRST